MPIRPIRRSYISLFLFCLIPELLLCQAFPLSGTVSDEDGLSLIGVNISEKENPSNGTTSNLDGTFSMSTSKENSILVFRYLGYQTLEINSEGRTEWTITMYPDSKQLDEVVITALGIKRQKRELGYSTESFEGDDIRLSNAPNVVSGLQGRSAGVQITGGNGVDGGTTRITIRGNNNIDSDNQPLIIIDGVPLQNEAGLTDVGRGDRLGLCH